MWGNNGALKSFNALQSFILLGGKMVRRSVESSNFFDVLAEWELALK